MNLKITKILFFVLGVAAIFTAGVSWWLTKTFGEVHILQVLWHIEKAHTLTGFDDSVFRHILQWFSLCLLGSAALYFVMFNKYIYIYMHRCAKLI